MFSTIVGSGALWFFLGVFLRRKFTPRAPAFSALVLLGACNAALGIAELPAVPSGTADAAVPDGSPATTDGGGDVTSYDAPSSDGARVDGGPKTDSGERTVDDIATGGDSVCLVASDGAVKCWGENSYGKLGLADSNNRGDGPGEMGTALPEVSLAQSSDQVSVGAGYACARSATGALKCWGRSDYGETGNGDTRPRGDDPGEMGSSLPAVDLGAGLTVRRVFAGAWHACALLAPSGLKCWGSNGHGELGLGDAYDRGSRPGEMGNQLGLLGLPKNPTAVAVGRNFTCAVLEDQSARCWGFNFAGQLGTGDTANRGDTAGTLPAKLPDIDVGLGKKIVSIAAGDAFVCAIISGNSVKCWGHNNFGQLGYGDLENRGDAPGEMGAYLPPVDLGAGTVEEIAAGSAHACARFSSGAVKCWGFNLYGQLGLGNTANVGDQPNEMGSSLREVDLGPGRAVKVRASGFHTCVQLADKSVRCWGRNYFGQLGQGDANDRGVAAGQLGASYPPVELGF